MVFVHRFAAHHPRHRGIAGLRWRHAFCGIATSWPRWRRETSRPTEYLRIGRGGAARPAGGAGGLGPGCRAGRRATGTGRPRAPGGARQRRDKRGLRVDAALQVPPLNFSQGSARPGAGENRSACTKVTRGPSIDSLVQK